MCVYAPSPHLKFSSLYIISLKCVNLFVNKYSNDIYKDILVAANRKKIYKTHLNCYF